MFAQTLCIISVQLFEVNKEDDTVCRCVMVCVISGNGFRFLSLARLRERERHMVSKSYIVFSRIKAVEH